MKLSIVIPTYKRNRVLCSNLPVLLRQITDEVELVIMDNASPQPVADDLAPVLAEFSNVAVRLLRHRANVGGAANILRSFEVADAPWLWILGDDDVVTPTAVQDVLATIAEHADAIFINFATSSMRAQGLRPRAINTSGLDEFVAELDHPGNINFMSVGIWRAASVVGALNKAYHFAYSMSPTFALLIASLGDKGRCHLSPTVLVGTVTTADAASKWQFRDFIMGWNTILELPMSEVSRRTMAGKMYSWHSPENVCVYLLAEASIRNQDGRRFYLASRRVGPYISAFARLRFWLYRPLFWRPALTWPLVQGAVNAAVRLKLKGADLSDIIERARH